LTGNPCTDFKGYRKYVIVTLPQLKSLDGQEIERCEKILAAQEYEDVKKLIFSQEQEYKGLFPFGLFNP
jgi:protein TilB